MELKEHHLNPAGRLFEFLTFTRLSSEPPTSNVFADYFECQPFSVPFFHAFAEIRGLPGQIESALKLLPAEALKWYPQERLTRSLPTLDVALDYFGPNTTTAVKHFNAQFSEANVLDLESCSQVMQAAWGQDDYKAATTQSALIRAGELVDQLVALLEADSDVSTSLRIELLDMAARLRLAISLGHVLGPEAAGRERDRVIGLIATQPKMQAELRAKPELKKAVTGILTTLSLVLGIFNGAVLAAGHVEPWLRELGMASTQSEPPETRTKSALPPEHDADPLDE